MCELVYGKFIVGKYVVHSDRTVLYRNGWCVVEGVSTRWILDTVVALVMACAMTRLDSTIRYCTDCTSCHGMVLRDRLDVI